MAGTVEDGWHKTIVTVAEDGTKRTRKVRTAQYGKGSQWRVRWDLPMGPDGKRRQRVRRGFSTKGEAAKFLREVLSEADKGRPVENHATTVAEAAEGYLVAKAAAGKAATTLDLWATVLRVHVVPRIGSVRAQALTAAQVEHLYAELALHGKAVHHGKAGVCRTAGVTCGDFAECSPERHAGLGSAILRHVHTQLRAVLRRTLGEHAALPTDSQRARDALPRTGPARVGRDEYWSDTQARQFLTATAGDPFAAVWAVALATGLRRSELAGLRWSDVHLDDSRPYLSVTRTVTVVRGRPVVKAGGKSTAAVRDVPLGQRTVEVLREHRRNQTVTPLDGTVFADPAGQVINPQRLTDAFTAATAAAGLPHVGLHGARHFAITSMLRRGVPVTTVAKVVGHEKPSITFDVYSHAIPDDADLAAAAMDAALGSVAV